VPSGLSYNFVCYWREFVVHVNGVVAFKNVISVTGLFRSYEFSILCIFLFLNENRKNSKRSKNLEASTVDFLQLTKNLHEYDLAVEAYIYPPANTSSF
jgi:glycyl-tRNA synthetase (class II)